MKIVHKRQDHRVIETKNRYLVKAPGGSILYDSSQEHDAIRWLYSYLSETNRILAVIGATNNIEQG